MTSSGHSSEQDLQEEMQRVLLEMNLAPHGVKAGDGAVHKIAECLNVSGYTRHVPKKIAGN